MRSCVVCGIPLGASRHGLAKYCSQTCIAVAKIAYQKQAHKNRYVKKERTYRTYRDEVHRRRCETQRNRALRRKLGLHGFECSCIVCGNGFSGHHSKCKTCSVSCRRVWDRNYAKEASLRYMQDPQKRQRRTEAAREHYRQNKEHRKIQARINYAKNIERYRQKQRTWRNNNRDKINELGREKRKKYVATIRLRDKRYEDRIRASFAALEALGLATCNESGKDRIKSMRIAVRSATELGLI